MNLHEVAPYTSVEGFISCPLGQEACRRPPAIKSPVPASPLILIQKLSVISSSIPRGSCKHSRYSLTVADSSSSSPQMSLPRAVWQRATGLHQSIWEGKYRIQSCSKAGRVAALRTRDQNKESRVSWILETTSAMGPVVPEQAHILEV